METLGTEIGDDPSIDEGSFHSCEVNKLVMSYKIDSTEGLSIAETNKIRVRLGLKPLSEGAGYVNSSEYEIECNSAEERKRKLARERRAALIQRISKEKEALNLNKKLVGPTLGDEDQGIPSSTSEWVKKHALKVKERKTAVASAEKARELEEQERTLSLSKSDNLEGLKVHHKLESLSKGEFILTLKDANILELEDTGDVLENVNLAEEERHQNNIAGIRAAKNNLGNEDELGNKLGLLSKYDYDQEKPDSDSIVLGSRGDVDLNAALALRNSKGTVPGRIMESLELAPPKEASSYEEVKESKIFRKKSNIRKIKAKIVEPHVNSVSGASEVLNALAEDDTNSSRDHGIRNKRSTELKPDFPPQPPLNDIPSKGTPPPKVIDYSKSNSKVDISNMNFVDDDDIQRALSASRRVTVIRTKIQDPMQIADSARTSDPNIPPPSDARGLVFSATTDFAKNLRIEPRIKPKESLKPKIIPEVPSTQTEDISLVLDRLESKKQDGGPRSGWIEITEDGNYTPPKNNDSMHSDGHISEREDVSTKLAGGGALEEEPLLSAGIGSAVTLLKQKGEIKQLTADELEKEKRILNRELWLSEKKRSMRINQLEMRNERENNRNKQKKGNKGGNDNNRVREEREIRRAKRERIAFTVDLYKNYSPEINLDRFDEFGRKLNQKEAFRQLSHKFHGKASGKIKTEKRLRKIHEELSTAQKSM